MRDKCCKGLSFFMVCLSFIHKIPGIHMWQHQVLSKKKSFLSEKFLDVYMCLFLLACTYGFCIFPRIPSKAWIGEKSCGRGTRQTKSLVFYILEQTIFEIEKSFIATISSENTFYG